jgi:hypothetical protein
VGDEWAVELEELLGAGYFDLTHFDYLAFYDLGGFGASPWQRSRFRRVLKKAADDIIEGRLPLSSKKNWAPWW